MDNCLSCIKLKPNLFIYLFNLPFSREHFLWSEVPVLAAVLSPVQLLKECRDTAVLGVAERHRELVESDVDEEARRRDAAQRHRRRVSPESRLSAHRLKEVLVILHVNNSCQQFM